MSPEQAHGAKKVDHRADLWSLGVIAYLAITGQLPFRGKGVGEVITKIVTQPHKPPSTLVAGVDPGFDAFFDKALAKKPRDRFGSAEDFAEQFDALATGVESSRRLLPLDGDAGDDDLQIESTDPAHEHTMAEKLASFDDATRSDTSYAADLTPVDAFKSEHLQEPPHSRPSATFWRNATLALAVAMALWMLLGRRTEAPSQLRSAGIPLVTAPPASSVAAATPPPTASASASAADPETAPSSSATSTSATNASPPGARLPLPERTPSNDDADAGRGLEHFDGRH